ncbi:LPP20 family lipoprotein [Treponema parvum]|uniref:LPP20 family lipoprotein n=1 Tax=Treponema parvum TaxID=138851 RepID=A0A975F3Q3_9SPIR|nr:LPP20 family lipoprotein [Treponema parvum]QTQ13802.1 LPP20 family lipoprotein [Treponema parvum]
MKKQAIIVAFSAIAAILMSCGSTKEAAKAKEEPTAASQVKKVVGAEGVERPAWVMEGKQSLDGIYAVGSAKMSNMQNSLKAARVNGRAELANTVQVSLKGATTTYAEDTGIPEDALNYMEEAIVARTDALLQGSTQADYWVGPDNTVYVLMFLPYEAVLPTVNDIVKDYAANQKSEITVEKVSDAVKKYKLLGN